MKRRRNSGFTFIELLVVIVVMGILIFIGVPKIRDAKKKAQKEMVITHLRNLMTSLEAHYTISNTYTTDLNVLGFSTLPSITADVLSVTPFGYQARVSEDVFGIECVVFTGDATALPPAIEAQILTCTY